MKLKSCFVCLAFSMFNCCIVLRIFTVFNDLMKVKILQRYDTVSYFRQINNINKVPNSFFLSSLKHSEFGALYLANAVVFQLSVAANWSFFVKVLCFCTILLFVKDMPKWISFFLPLLIFLRRLVVQILFCFYFNLVNLMQANK